MFAHFNYNQLDRYKNVNVYSLKEVLKSFKVSIGLYHSNGDEKTYNLGINFTSTESLMTGSNFGKSGNWIFPFNDNCSN